MSTANVRYMQKGIVRFYWVPAIASATKAPTVAEVTAGTRLDTDLAEINGFRFANSPIATPDMASTFVPSIPGEETVTESSLGFYERRTTNAAKSALAKGTTGFVVIFYAGTAGAAPAAGDKVDVWPAQVTHNTRQYTAGNEPARYEVGFAIAEKPGEALSVLA